MISRNVLERALDALKIASDDATRYTIGGVLIQANNKQVKLVATNGHMLLERELSGECPDGVWMLRHDDAKALRLALKEYKHGETLDCAIDMQGGLLIGSDAGMKARIGKAKVEDYPPYQQVIPTFANPTAISISAEYLFEIAKALHTTKGGKDTAHIRIVFDPTDWSKPVRVVALGESNALGVIMPVRDEPGRAIVRDFKESLERQTEAVTA